jgi:subtilisin family serine protease
LDSVADDLRGFSTMVSDHRPPESHRRRILTFECEPADFERKKAEWGPEVIAEAEKLRYPAVAFSANAGRLVASNAAYADALGNQDAFGLSVSSAQGPVADASVTVTFMPLAGVGGGPLPQVALTTSAGRAEWRYDARKYRAGTLIIMPKGGAWSWLQPNPANGMEIRLPSLPQDGPIGWWHHLLGLTGFDPAAGRGVKIGVIDTGVGPHPFLSHVQSIGAFVNGAFQPQNGGPGSTGAGDDVENHGTHVSGIIGARPPSGTGAYGGIAPGADVWVARVYAPADPAKPSSTPQTTNADIANAIDELAVQCQADLLNLSLGGTEPSEIEQDAIQVALELGTLAVCAAGNFYGAPVLYPAALPQTVGVSAVGITSAAPPGSLDASAVPTQPDRFYGSLYAASFNNVGPGITCTGPGVGIISTVPAWAGAEAPYAAMSGTSMACPAVCAALASVLGKDNVYLQMPRNALRAGRAYEVLLQTLRPLGSLAPDYVGGGLATAAAALTR